MCKREGETVDIDKKSEIKAVKIVTNQLIIGCVNLTEDNLSKVSCSNNIARNCRRPQLVSPKKNVNLN